MGHPWSWSWKGNGQAIVVSGGSSSVNTDDLRSLAAAIESAAGFVSQAAAHASNARAQVDDVVIPARPTVMRANTGASQYPQVYIEPAAASNNGPDPDEVKRLKDAAQEDLDDVTVETCASPSLGAVAGRLSGLAKDVLACADMYDAANGKATPAPGSSVTGPASPLAIPGLTNGVITLGARMFTLAVLDSISRVTVADQLLDVLGLDLPADIVQGIETLMSDPGTSLWVLKDVFRLMVLGFAASRASTGQEAATVQQEIRAAAQRLDPWVKERLPDKVQIGTQLVDPSTLTPVQRCTYYISLLAAQSARQRYGASTGVEVSERSTVQGDKTPVRTMKVPPSTKDPFGLKSAVPPTSLQGGNQGGYQAVPLPSATVSGTIEFSRTLQSDRHLDDKKIAAISIQRIDHVDGRKSYLVTIPGTVDWGSGSAAGQDLLTNTQGAAGAPTDMESGVVTAMRAAGIQPGDEVALYGHSQGGITAVNIAADPEVAKQFNVTTVLTAGAPTAHVQLPDKVHALHLENTADAVPALSGGPTPTGANRVVVQVDTHEKGIKTYPHDSGVYAQVTQGLEGAGEPAVEEWSEHYRQFLGEGEQRTLADGTVVTATASEVVYDIKRTFD